MFDKKRRIRISGFKTQRRKELSKPVIPSARSLFEAIHGFMQFTDELRMIEIFKTRRLRHIDFLLENTMQKCIFDI
jgi:hypothetical protein